MFLIFSDWSGPTGISTFGSFHFFMMCRRPRQAQAVTVLVILSSDLSPHVTLCDDHTERDHHTAAAGEDPSVNTTNASKQLELEPTQE